MVFACKPLVLIRERKERLSFDVTIVLCPDAVLTDACMAGLSQAYCVVEPAKNIQNGTWVVCGDCDPALLYFSMACSLSILVGYIADLPARL